MVKYRTDFSYGKALAIFGPFLAQPLCTPNEPHPTPRPWAFFLCRTGCNIDGFPHLSAGYHRPKEVAQDQRNTTSPLEEKYWDENKN